MLSKLKQKIGRHVVNIPGWRTKRKIIVFESDDWGSIRMPSKDAYKSLLTEGIPVDRSTYDKFDTLEQRDDLEMLFNLLSKYKGMNGEYPVFTFNTVMCNPAFDQIEADQFEKYYYEDFFTSYRVYNSDNLEDLWCRAIDEKLIRPQFHAREHLNVSLWMKALRLNDTETKIAFNHRFFGLKTKTPSRNQNNYLAAYWAEGAKDFNGKLNILKDGLKLFKKTFGFQSESFVACNYIYPVEFESKLSKLGINYIQTQRGHLSPKVSVGSKKIRRHYLGQENKHKQIYLVRNCFFEPTVDSKKDSVDKCLKEIKTAFQWNKPAIISTHRINYVGGLSIDNREHGINRLNKLLSRIVNIWPNVEFLSTDKLGRLIKKSK